MGSARGERVGGGPSGVRACRIRAFAGACPEVTAIPKISTRRGPLRSPRALTSETARVQRCCPRMSAPRTFGSEGVRRSGLPRTRGHHDQLANRRRRTRRKTPSRMTLVKCERTACINTTPRRGSHVGASRRGNAGSECGGAAVLLVMRFQPAGRVPLSGWSGCRAPGADDDGSRSTSAAWRLNPERTGCQSRSE